MCAARCVLLVVACCPCVVYFWFNFIVGCNVVAFVISCLSLRVGCRLWWFAVCAKVLSVVADCALSGACYLRVVCCCLCVVRCLVMCVFFVVCCLPFAF